jgi:hypothetical protein
MPQFDIFKYIIFCLCVYIYSWVIEKILKNKISPNSLKIIKSISFGVIVYIFIIIFIFR